MAQVISIGTALLRICPTNNKKIEYSSNGKYWTTHYTGSTYGEFYDLLFLLLLPKDFMYLKMKEETGALVIQILPMASLSLS